IVIDMRAVVLFLVLWVTLAECVEMDHFVLAKRGRRCQYERSHGMNAAVCNRLDLQEVPTNLKSNIEILAASLNRIRELYKTTFSNYQYLKILYLEDNMIMYIENGTFSPLQSLEVIDLSSNSLDAVPRELLTLPYLRKLYMNNNRLSAYAGLLGSPPSQSLEFLSLAKCHLKQFPPLEGYHNMKILNLSDNELTTLTTQNLAPMCLLNTLYLSGNSHILQGTGQDGACGCFVVESWIKNKAIFLPNNFKLNCSTNKFSGSCVNVTYPEESLQLYDTCINLFKTQQEIATSRTIWIVALVVAILFLVVLGTGLYYIHRRNRRKSLRDKNRNLKKYNGDVTQRMVKYDNDDELDT
ncbi:hypothetical protein L9F63_019539, partial [Diploptera punctata]